MHLEKSDKRRSRMHEVVNEVFFSFFRLTPGYWILFTQSGVEQSLLSVTTSDMPSDTVTWPIS
jgi:hypothetical protein